MKPQGNNKRAYDEGYQARVDNKERRNPYSYTNSNMVEAWWATGYDKADADIKNNPPF